MNFKVKIMTFNFIFMTLNLIITTLKPEIITSLLGFCFLAEMGFHNKIIESEKS